MKNGSYNHREVMKWIDTHFIFLNLESTPNFYNHDSDCNGQCVTYRSASDLGGAHRSMCGRCVQRCRDGWLCWCVMQRSMVGRCGVRPERWLCGAERCRPVPRSVVVFHPYSNRGWDGPIGPDLNVKDMWYVIHDDNYSCCCLLCR